MIQLVYYNNKLIVISRNSPCASACPRAACPDYRFCGFCVAKSYKSNIGIASLPVLPDIVSSGRTGFSLYKENEEKILFNQTFIICTRLHDHPIPNPDPLGIVFGMTLVEAIYCG
jgi:hypothetical protein